MKLNTYAAGGDSWSNERVGKLFGRGGFERVFRGRCSVRKQKGQKGLETKVRKWGEN